MNIPNYNADQYIDADTMNAGSAAISGSIGTALLADFSPGLFGATTAAIGATGLNVSMTLPLTFGVLFGSGSLSQAHGILNNADTQSYSVNFSGLVPASGAAITAYAIMSYQLIQQSPQAVIGPPPGHPDFNPNFIPYTGFLTNVDSLNISASTTAPNNSSTFELFRCALAPGATGVGTLNRAFQTWMFPKQASSNRANAGLNTIYENAGNPNGALAGTAATASTPPDLCYDTSNNLFWWCATTGTSGTAVWNTLGPARSVVGATSRVTAARATAGTTVEFTADQIGVATALGGLGTTVVNFDHILTITNVGVDGMDTGSAPINGFLSIYAIYNPSTGAANLLGTVASQTTVYGGANMPAGYTMSALLAIWPTDASRNLVAGAVSDRTFYYAAGKSVLGSANNTVATAIDLSAAVPLQARLVYVMTAALETNTVTSNSGIMFGPTAASVAGSLYSVTSVVVAAQSDSTMIMPIVESQKMYYRVGQFTMSAGASVNGYTI